MSQPTPKRTDSAIRGIGLVFDSGVGVVALGAPFLLGAPVSKRP